MYTCYVIYSKHAFGKFIVKFFLAYASELVLLLVSVCLLYKFIHSLFIEGLQLTRVL